MDEQFDLSYYVKGMSYIDTEEMTAVERRAMYNRLIRRKETEKEEYEKASKKTSVKKK